MQNEIAALTLDERGVILESNRSAEKLFGYTSGELFLQHISLLLPQLEEGRLIKGGGIDPRLRFMCHCGHMFQLVDRQCNSFLSELRIFELNNLGRRTLRVILPTDSVITGRK